LKEAEIEKLEPPRWR